MDPNLVNFLINYCSGVATNLTTEALKAAYQRVFAARPDLEKRLSHPESAADTQAALGELAGNLEALAGDGSITMDGGVIKALRSVTLDHQDGTLRIGNTLVSAPLLTTGGTGRGSTTIGSNTELRSESTSLKTSPGASMVITGNARIKQS
jgi:hypothetical protein